MSTQTAIDRKPTWTPDLDYKTIEIVNVADLHRIHAYGALRPKENAAAVIIGSLVIWMDMFRKEFAATFDEDLSEWLHLGFDGDDFTISADGPGIDLLQWLTMPLQAFVYAYGFEWRQDAHYYWTLVPASR